MPTKTKIQYIKTKDYSKEELYALHEYFQSIRLTQYLPAGRTSTKTIATFEQYSSDYYSYISEEEIDYRYEEYVPNFKLIVTDIKPKPIEEKHQATRIWIALEDITSKDLLLIEELLSEREFVRVTENNEITFLDYKNIWINEDKKIWGFTDIGPVCCCDDKYIQIDALNRVYSHTTIPIKEEHISLFLKDLWNIFWPKFVDGKEDMITDDIDSLLNKLFEGTL